MTRRRGNNEGCLHQKANGSWKAAVTVQGRRLYKTCKTRQEAQFWLKQTISQVDDGLTFASTRRMLKDHIGIWLENERAIMRQSTWSHYEQLTRTYIIPKIGSITLKNLRTEHIQAFYNRLVQEGVGAFTVQKVHILLHGALKLAVEAGTLARNPVSYAHPPKPASKEMKILDESQVSQFLVYVMGHRWEALFRLAIVTGMRQMELLGLKWDDLDWIQQTIRVERQLIRPKSHSSVTFQSTKTKYGRRIIDLDRETIELLRAHYDHNSRGSDDGLMFTTSNGTPILPRNLLRDFYILLEGAGLPRIRFHDLRHTAASLMLNHGVQPIVVSRRLGHSKVSITLDIYGHLIPGMQAEAAELISELITPVKLFPTVPNCAR